MQFTGMFGDGKGDGLGDVEVCRFARGHDSWRASDARGNGFGESRKGASTARQCQPHNTVSCCLEIQRTLDTPVWMRSEVKVHSDGECRIPGGFVK